MRDERPERVDSGEGADDDGVDVSLIRWALSLTVQERLELLQRNAAALARLTERAAAQP